MTEEDVLEPGREHQPSDGFMASSGRLGPRAP